MITITFTITSVGIQCHDAFIPSLGSRGPQWGPVDLTCPYLCLSLYISVSLSGCPHLFLAIKACCPSLRTSHANAVHGVKYPEWKYNMKIRPSVHLVVQGPLTIFEFAFNNLNTSAV